MTELNRSAILKLLDDAIARGEADYKAAANAAAENINLKLERDDRERWFEHAVQSWKDENEELRAKLAEVITSGDDLAVAIAPPYLFDPRRAEQRWQEATKDFR